MEKEKKFISFLKVNIKSRKFKRFVAFLENKKGNDINVIPKIKG